MTTFPPQSVDQQHDGVDPELCAWLGVGFERSAAPMLLTDDALRVIVCANPAAQQLLAADTLTGQLLTRFSPFDEVSQETWASAALACRQEPVDFESEMVTSGGDRLLVSVRCEVPGVAVGNYLLLQLRDLTRERQVFQASRHRSSPRPQQSPNIDNFPFDGDRAGQLQLAQIHELSSIGSCRYNRAGWVFDQELLDLWGVDRAETPQAAVTDLLMAADQTDTLEQWGSTLSTGGRCRTHYRIRHGRTGQIRHISSTLEAVVDTDHTLLGAVATHLDVTDVVTATEFADIARTAVAQERSELVRRVGDLIATTRLGVDELLLTIAELASAALGAGVVLRILAPGELGVEREVIARDAEPARHNPEHVAAISAASFVPPGIVGEVIEHGRLVSTIDVRERDPDLLRQIDETSGESDCFVVAPIRHDGLVLGLLAVSREAPGKQFEPGDDDLLQVLADRAGSAVAENRALESAARGRVERDAVAGKLHQLSTDQQQLLEQLTSLETRERTMLAEVIHDEPIQLIVAAILRIDLVSARSRESGGDADELDRIATLLETSVDRLRRLIVALLPPDLNDGLGVALRDLASGIFTGTTTVFHVIDHVTVDVAISAREAAYRIFREAMVNARKHARADNVTLRLDHRDAMFVLSLTDDGVGSESLDVVPGHLGMATMRARAAAEGGRLRCEKAPGGGTIVELILPMPEQAG